MNGLMAHQTLGKASDDKKNTQHHMDDVIRLHEDQPIRNDCEHVIAAPPPRNQVAMGWFGKTARKLPDTVRLLLTRIL
jgi:hypothetical protein